MQLKGFRESSNAERVAVPHLHTLLSDQTRARLVAVERHRPHLKPGGKLLQLRNGS